METNKILNGCGYIPETPPAGSAKYKKIFGSAPEDPINWKPFLPKRERQYAVPFCVAFSRLNCGEAKYVRHLAEEASLRKFNKPIEDLTEQELNSLIAEVKVKNDILNLSDRYLGVISGTSKNGNSFIEVSYAFKKKGVVAEKECPWTTNMLYKPSSYWSKIFDLSGVDPDARKYYGGNYSYVDVDNASLIGSALAHSPVQLGIPVGETYAGGNTIVITPPKNIRGYHGITCYWVDNNYYYIQDSIGEEFKKLTINYPVRSAMSFRDLPANWREMQMAKERINYKGEQYLVDEKTIHRIPDEETLRFLFKMEWAKDKVRKIDSIANYEVGQDIPSVPLYKKAVELFPILEDVAKMKVEKAEVGSTFSIIKQTINFFKALLRLRKK